MSRSVPGVHFACSGDVKQPRNKPTLFDRVKLPLFRPVTRLHSPSEAIVQLIQHQTTDSRLGRMGAGRGVGEVDTQTEGF